jgi:hypothetical protein
MRVIMLDTLQEVELDEIEAVRRIDARVAVEAPLGSNQVPETATLDRSANTMTQPRPQSRPAPKREKRGAGRGKRG